MIEIFERAQKEHAAGVDFVMVTVVETTGSVPAVVGGRMIVMKDETVGTVGGGALEKDAVQRARNILADMGDPLLVREKVSDLKMQCGGGVTLFFEPFLAATPLWIFGGGHVSQALVPVAASIGFNVTVVDNRTEFSDPKRFPAASKAIHSPYNEAAKTVPGNAYVVIVTHGHSHDEETIRELAQADPPLPYIGMIGSRSKVPIVLKSLKADGIEPGDNIYAPIGLPIGGGSPAEIAVSIAAELLAVKNKKTALPHHRDAIKKSLSDQ